MTPLPLSCAMPVLAMAVVAAASAQTVTPIHPGQAGSPHVRYEREVEGVHVSIEYGRPRLKGRALADLAPAGRIWRTGADEATTFRASRALVLGPHVLEAGHYSLYTIPGPREWMLVVNADHGQWGTVYDAARDVLRVPMTVRSGQPMAEELTISIERAATGHELRIGWGDVLAAVSIRAK